MKVLGPELLLTACSRSRIPALRPQESEAQAMSEERARSRVLGWWGAGTMAEVLGHTSRIMGLEAGAVLWPGSDSVTERKSLRSMYQMYLSENLRI